MVGKGIWGRVKNYFIETILIDIERALYYSGGR